MRITFCLPTHNYKSPIGGFKIVYEYANRLVERNHEVRIVYWIERSLLHYPIPQKIKEKAAKWIVSMSPKWFDLDKRVKKIAAPKLIDDYIPDGDIIIATAQVTASYIHKLNLSKGKKYYFIQDFENWNVSDEEVYDTYRLGMNNIVISKWLRKLIKDHGAEAYYIQNPIDINKFKVINPICNRNPFSFGLLYHQSSYKGVKYALEVLERLKRNYPNIEVHMFGNPSRPHGLPKWFQYSRNATQEEVIEIYNQCSIFLCASIKEGFGLTGLESMACGCAFVSSNYQGVFEYATNEKNAFISEIKDVEKMYKNAEKLLLNDKLRIRIAENAVKTAQTFSWDQAVTKFETYIEGK